MNLSTPPLLTELLSEEHRLIQRGLVVLARLCAHLRRGGEADPEAAGELLRFIRTYADTHHHAKEEDVLFPWMAANGCPQGAGPIQVMLADHEQARGLVAAMERSSKEMNASGAALDARNRFVQNAESYALLLWGHIWKEDNVLYPMAERLGEGTAGLYALDGDSGQLARAVEAEFRAVIERLESRAASWPPEDLPWPQGCH